MLDAGSRQGDAEEGDAPGSPVPLRIEASESRTPQSREDPGDQRRQIRLVKATDAPPQKSKGSSFATLVARALEVLRCLA